MFDAKHNSLSGVENTEVAYQNAILKLKTDLQKYPLNEIEGAWSVAVFPPQQTTGDALFQLAFPHLVSLIGTCPR